MRCTTVIFYIDDSIEDIKKKIILAYEKRISFNSIYLFGLQEEKLNPVKVYQNLTQNEKLELIHVMPGAKIPQHTHEGNESFLVLHGSYSDEYGSYKQGTVQVRSDDHHHTPIGHTQTGCVGLAYTHGKIKFSGKFGKLLNLIAN